MCCISTNPTELAKPGVAVVLAIGVFDGVHLGHQRVIRRALELAREVRAQAICLTFDPHPAAVAHPQIAPRLIQRVEERAAWIQAVGVDAIWLLKFDRAIMEMRPADFVRFLLRWLGRIRAVVVGERFVFGFRRSGSVDVLRSLGREYGFDVFAEPLVRIDGAIVSSSRIRQLLAEGSVEVAERLLGHSYWLRSLVIEGDRLGRQFGFPTANLAIDDLVVPPRGVYIAQAILDDSPASGISQPVPAVMNIGLRPTLRRTEPELRVEVHLLDMKVGLYGHWLAVRPLLKLRDELAFPDIESLKRQIAQDVEEARRWFRGHGYVPTGLSKSVSS